MSNCLMHNTCVQAAVQTHLADYISDRWNIFDFVLVLFTFPSFVSHQVQYTEIRWEPCKLACTSHVRVCACTCTPCVCMCACVHVYMRVCVRSYVEHQVQHHAQVEPWHVFYAVMVLCRALAPASPMARLLAPPRLGCWPRHGLAAGPTTARLLAPPRLGCWRRHGSMTKVRQHHPGSRNLSAAAGAAAP